jgi:hypothetical protein
MASWSYDFADIVKESTDDRLFVGSIAKSSEKQLQLLVPCFKPFFMNSFETASVRTSIVSRINIRLIIVQTNVVAPLKTISCFFYMTQDYCSVMEVYRE